MKQNRRKEKKPPLILGLTGGIGSGKSEASKIFNSLGFFVIDCDKIAKECMKYNSECYKEIIQHFGYKIISKNLEIDRKALSSIVFNNKLELKILSKIVHKYVKIKIIEIIKNTKDSKILIDAPVLIEANMQDMVHYIIGIFADKETRIERIKKRDGLNLIQIENRINSQMDDSILKNHMDFVIENNGCLNDLEKEIRKLFLTLR